MRAGHACLVCGGPCRGSCVDLVLEVALAAEDLEKAAADLAIERSRAAFDPETETHGGWS